MTAQLLKDGWKGFLCKSDWHRCLNAISMTGEKVGISIEQPVQQYLHWRVVSVEGCRHLTAWTMCGKTLHATISPWNMPELACFPGWLKKKTPPTKNNHHHHPGSDKYFLKKQPYTLISDCKSQQDYCWTRKEDMKKDFSVLIPPPLYTTMKAMAHSLLKEKITCAYNCSSKCFQVMH